MAAPAGFEPTSLTGGGYCPKPLDEGALSPKMVGLDGLEPPFSPEGETS